MRSCIAQPVISLQIGHKQTPFTVNVVDTSNNSEVLEVLTFIEQQQQVHENMDRKYNLFIFCVHDLVNRGNE